MHTVRKEREKLTKYVLLFNNSTSSLCVVVRCVQTWVENGFAEPAKYCARKMVKRGRSQLVKNALAGPRNNIMAKNAMGMGENSLKYHTQQNLMALCEKNNNLKR